MTFFSRVIFLGILLLVPFYAQAANTNTKTNKPEKVAAPKKEVKQEKEVKNPPAANGNADENAIKEAVKEALNLLNEVAKGKKLGAAHAAAKEVGYKGSPAALYQMLLSAGVVKVPLVVESISTIWPTCLERSWLSPE